MDKKLTELLYLRFCVIYDNKFGKNHTDELRALWVEEWSQGLENIDIQSVKPALDHCRINLEWPPSITEFRRLCEEASGFPSFDEAFSKAIRRDFTHPIIQIAFDKIGDWAFKHDTEKDLSKKFKAAYQNAVHDYRINPAKYLPASNIKSFPVNTTAVKDTATAVSSTVPDDVKKMGFKERIAYEQEKMKKAADEANLQHPAWEKEKYTINHPNFVESVYLERRDYLMKLPEYAASTLNSVDWYDRVSFLREKEAYNKEIRRNPTPDTQTYEKVSKRPYNKPRRANDYWNS